MRRGYVLLAMTAVAIGGYAEAGPDSTAPTPAVLDGIRSFIAQQRDADMAACAARGETDLEACARDIARARRARLNGDGTTGTAAGTEI